MHLDRPLIPETAGKRKLTLLKHHELYLGRFVAGGYSPPVVPGMPPCHDLTSVNMSHSDSIIRTSTVISGMITSPPITDSYVIVPSILPTNSMMSFSRMRTGASS